MKPFTKRITVFLTIFTTSGLLLSLIHIPRPVYASDFEIHVQRIFTAQENKNTLHVTEKRTITSNSYTYYIPATSKETFILQNFKEDLDPQELALKKESLIVTNNLGIAIPYSINQEGEDLIVEVNYPSSVTNGNSLIFIVEYDTTELMETVGNVINIYIPGLEEKYKPTITDTSTDTTTQITYSTTLEIPSSFDDPAFTFPSPTSISEDNSCKTYTFSTGSLLGKSVWHQIGTEQIYQFKIIQPASQTDFFTPKQLDFLSKSKYTLLIPREYDETHQKVFFSKFSPTPDEINIDSDGNVRASFFVNATQDNEIVIEGFITTSLDNYSSADNDPSIYNNTSPDNDDSPVPQQNHIPDNAVLDDILNFSDMSKYLEPSEFWEVNSKAIQDKAEELAGSETNILKILKADYSFIVESIDYDDFKYGDANERQGALATLNGSDSVCMEYSDLLITIARAQGIPARAAYGYGYDPAQPEDKQESHQWVQVWIPDHGWLSMDPTWGETGRDFIGQDLDHALWYVASTHPDKPSPLEVTSSNTDFELESSHIEIIAVDSIPDDITLKTLESIIEEIKPADNTESLTEISRVVQTSLLGKTLVILLPACGSILGFTILISLVVKLLSRVRRKRRVSLNREI